MQHERKSIVALVINVVIVTMALAATPLGCQTVEERLALADVTQTPLPFDPTETYEFGAWWTNGRELLRLDETGGYVLYPGLNRYQKPIERGSWSKQNYVELRMAPYDRLHSEWNRVAIEKTGGRIILRLPDRAPMFSIDGPPYAPEDDLFGSWESDAGTLRLGQDKRYAFAADPSHAPETHSPAVVTGHRGRWRLENDRLHLVPDPPNMKPFEILVRGTGDDTVLIGPDGVLRRPAPVTPPREIS